MIELFTNPGYVAAGGALISSPIIIHLINRMRFKRLRWAAMEFLLKAQKRSRRRLIIEQLLLLLLRCLLVLLAALLVSRFLGFSFGSTADQETLHVVVLDDTLSMTDKEDKEGAVNCFKVAKDLITKKIVYNLKQSNAVERLTIIPLSKLVTDPDYQFKTYGDLGESAAADKIDKDLAELVPTKLHVELIHGINKANDLIRANPNSKVVVHVLSDFRKDDWTGTRARGLHQALLKMTADTQRGVIVRLIDTVGPYRVENQGGVPAARDNLAIVDFQATNRVVPRGRRAEFRITVANNSTSEASVRLIVYDDATGKEIDEGDFLDRMPLVVPAMGSATARFATPTGRFETGAEDQKVVHARLSARLVNPDRTNLKNDGISEDNLRHASVELRDQVPILLVDSRGAKGMELEPVFKRPVYDMAGKLLREVTLDIPDKKAGDGLAVRSAIEREIIDPVKRTARPIYKAVLGHELGGGDGRTVLTSPDLDKYQSIILMNVESLEDEQLARLEKYVQNGGGVAFFLGPKVNPGYYNDKLYKNGEGIFPVPLAGEPFPPIQDKNRVVPRRDPFQFQLLLREDLAPSEDQVLIFGPLLRQNKNQIGWLKVAPVDRYFPTLDRKDWGGGAGKVKEILTRPNTDPVGKTVNVKGLDRRVYVEEVRELARDINAVDDRYKSYRPGLKRHNDELLRLTDVNSPAPEKAKEGDDKKDGDEKPAAPALLVDVLPAYEVADVLGALLNDRGQVADLKNYPNLVEFWNLPDKKVSELRDRVVEVRQRLRYSHPMLLVKEYGKGRVAVWMSTAGNEWNPWASTGIYAPMLFEMQNYLASQGGSNAQLLGPGTPVHVDPAQFPDGVKDVRVVRYFFRPEPGQPEKALDPERAREVVGGREPQDEKKENKKGDKTKGDKAAEQKPPRVFEFQNTPEPGFALLKVFNKANPDDTDAIEEISQVYNVDARREGNLARVSQDEMETTLLREANGSRRFDQKAITFMGPEGRFDDLVARPQDLSQTPWFFLFFLAILVAEQALAVHLSFHLRSNEAELPAQVGKPQARAA